MYIDLKIPWQIGVVAVVVVMERAHF